MQILITGGAGFVGSHLCRAIIALGHTVICLDNLYTGSKENIEDLLDNPRFTFLLHDVTEPITLEVDQIYNLACPASPGHYQNNPVKTILTNVLGMTNMLELARRTGARILQASTSEVYGDPAVHPQTETYWGNVNPIGPRSCYDEGKRCAETLCMDYCNQYRTDTRIARIFNTYGPNMAVDDGRVVSNFIIQALRGASVSLYGNGEQTRSFCYVSDTVRGLIGLMECEALEVHLPVNIGNPYEVGIGDLLKKVLKLTGSQSTIENNGLPRDDPKRRCPDISSAKQMLNWEPSVTLDEGLKKTIEYFEGCQL